MEKSKDQQDQVHELFSIKIAQFSDGAIATQLQSSIGTLNPLVMIGVLEQIKHDFLSGKEFQDPSTEEGVLEKE